MAQDDRQIELLTPDEAARMLGRTPRYLAFDRQRGPRVPYVKIGRAIRYDRRALEQVIAEYTVAAQR
jgi:hypothetical protein